ncbi:MAG: rhodanese-like domain-containing protein, partial [Chloroflexota bacterium]|nr:rhodanese-like domain-containing protein [Chloroflexota bacterium]
MSTAVIATISREELKRELDRNSPVVIVEALPEPFYRKAHLPGALNIPLDRIDELAPLLLPDKDAQIVVYCANLPCENSEIAARRLMQLGYRNVRDYAEG